MTGLGAPGGGHSAGDGLDLTDGVLSVLAGVGIGIDANGNVYVPDASLGTGKLSFDPATQTELNNHAGKAGAHHSKPVSVIASGSVSIAAGGSAVAYDYTNGNPVSLMAVPTAGSGAIEDYWGDTTQGLLVNNVNSNYSIDATFEVMTR